MMKLILFLFIGLVASMSKAQEIAWPSLSDIKFTSGRVAVEDDINAGQAVFLLMRDGLSISRPMEIEVPQYAFHNNEESGFKTPVIVIQAEVAEENEVIGYYNFELDELGVGLIHEFDLLGREI